MNKLILPLVIIATSGAYVWSQQGRIAAENVMGGDLPGLDALASPANPTASAAPFTTATASVQSRPAADTSAQSQPLPLPLAPTPVAAAAPAQTEVSSPAPAPRQTLPVQVLAVSAPAQNVVQSLPAGQGETVLTAAAQPTPVPLAPAPQSDPVPLAPAPQPDPVQPAATVLTVAANNAPVPLPRLNRAAAPNPGTTLVASTSQASGQYKDGSWRGPVTDAYYGLMQVEAKVSGGRITSVAILQYPNDRQTSRYINGRALPLLKREAVRAQSGKVHFVSGATLSSRAYIASLTAALQLASQ